MENLKSPVLRDIDTKDLFLVYVERYEYESIISLAFRTNKILEQYYLSVAISKIIKNKTEWYNSLEGLKCGLKKKKTQHYLNYQYKG